MRPSIFLFLPPFYPLLSTSLELKHTQHAEAAEMGLTPRTQIHYLTVQLFLPNLPFSSSADFSPFSTCFMKTKHASSPPPLSLSIYHFFSSAPSSLHPYLHPVSIHFMEENTERVRLRGYISVQQAGRGHGQLHPSDAVLRCNTACLALSGRA